MKKKIYNFNLIEIVLTVAVISFGVVVILGMLPRGLQVTRNTATVNHASEIIDQLGGYFQLNGADSVSATDFAEKDPGAASGDKESDIMKNCKKLVQYIHKPGEMPKKTVATAADELGDDYIPTGIAGVFRCADEPDVYIIVMGDSREIDGEQEINTDFSGLLQVCKQNDVEGKIICINHDTAEHDCFNDDKQICGVNPTDFKVEKKNLGIGRIYMELSYPLTKPYNSRTKKYYSFDVKK